MFRNINQVLSERDLTLNDPDHLVFPLFTHVTALQELVRAAEGVPRDAITILSRAALRAGDRRARYCCCPSTPSTA